MAFYQGGPPFSRQKSLPPGGRGENFFLIDKKTSPEACFQGTSGVADNHFQATIKGPAFDIAWQNEVTAFFDGINLAIDRNAAFPIEDTVRLYGALRFFSTGPSICHL